MTNRDPVVCICDCQDILEWKLQCNDVTVTNLTLVHLAHVNDGVAFPLPALT